jgi:hypothetical protein
LPPFSAPVAPCYYPKGWGESESWTQHQVLPDDDLLEMAGGHRTTVADILKVNCLSSTDDMAPGMWLWLPYFLREIGTPTPTPTTVIWPTPAPYVDWVPWAAPVSRPQPVPPVTSVPWPTALPPTSVPYPTWVPPTVQPTAQPAPTMLPYVAPIVSPATDGGAPATDGWDPVPDGGAPAYQPLPSQPKIVPPGQQVPGPVVPDSPAPAPPAPPVTVVVPIIK